MAALESRGGHPKVSIGGDSLRGPLGPVWCAALSANVRRSADRSCETMYIEEGHESRDTKKDIAHASYVYSNMYVV